ncbi:MAG: hypothetical protein AMXMBFR13_47660 [Phycisphaerae bacterium]
MAADYSLQAQPAAPQRAPLADRLDHVIAAGRMKLTSTDQQRPECHLVAADQRLHQQSGQPAAGPDPWAKIDHDSIVRDPPAAHKKNEPDREIRLVSISVNSVFIRRAAGLLLTAA